MRWTSALLAILLLMAGAVAASSAAPPVVDPTLDEYLTPQTLAVLPDGRRLHLFCKGRGEPIAIVAPGWHIPALGWNKLQPAMAQLTRVCLYDRPGYSFSDPGPMPRDTAAEVKDLHDALGAAGLQGPYVLVGHSLGGFDARMFAYAYPKETAGLLLLDPPTEQIFQQTRQPDEDVELMARCAARVQLGPIDWNDRCLDNGLKLGPRWSDAMRSKVLADQNRTSWWETLESEDRSMVTRSADEMVAARRKLGSIPLIVLQSDTHCPRTPQRLRLAGRGDFDARRCAELAGQARDSTRGQWRIVPGASHMIQDDKPDVVIKAFGDVLQVARAAGPKATAGL